MSLAPVTLTIVIAGTSVLAQLVECAMALERIASRIRDIEDDLAMEAEDREQNAILDAEQLP